MKRYLATLLLTGFLQGTPQSPPVVLSEQELRSILAVKDDILNAKLVQLVQYESLVNQLNQALKARQDEIEKLKKEGCKQ